MKFSIILPVKNGGAYIKECVQSILSQTYTEFNLHILENCSTDGTGEWLTTLNDKRIIVYPASEPLSIEENWGRIIAIPKNEFMTVIGHDDLLDKNYLEVMDALIKKYPDASLYQTHFRYIDGKGRLVRNCKPMREKQVAAEFLADLFTDSIDTMGTGYMMKTKDYDTLGGIQPYPNLLFADHELWIKLTFINYKITASQECFFYRLHENLSKRSDAVRYIHAFYRFMHFLEAFKSKNVEVNNVIQHHAVNYIRYYCRSLAHRLLRTPEKQRAGVTVTAFVKECIKYARLLAPGQSFYPYKQFNIRFARTIDNHAFSRKLYIFFRKLYKKPIYS